VADYGIYLLILNTSIIRIIKILYRSHLFIIYLFLM